MTSMEISFPRGSAKTANTDDKSEVKKSHKKEGTKKRDAADFLFGSSSSTENKTSSLKSNGKRRKKEKTTVKSTSRSLLPFGGGAVVHPAKGEGWIEALGFSKLHPGLSLLAVVREIHNDLCVFSLPNQWTGFVLAKTDGKDNVDCHAMFQVGQMMAVKIVKAVQETTKLGPRRRIQVTASPEKVNSPLLRPKTGSLIRGQIMSMEDHGFLINLGWQRRGFLKFDDIQGPYQLADKENDADNSMETNARVLGVGRILDFHVKKMDGTVAALELLSDNEAKKKLSIANLPPLEDLQPCTLVQCTVDRMVKNGLCVSFGAGAYRGAIDLHHLGGYWLPDHREESKDWRTVFEKHRSFKARIIAVDASAKIVRLSIQKHLLDMVMPTGFPELGSVHDATTVRLDEGVGALLALPDRKPPVEAAGVIASSELYDNESYQEASRVQCVYVHISKAINVPEKGRTSDSIFAKEFAPSTKHRVRILNTSNMVEGIIAGAAAPDIVDAKVMSYSDLHVGNLYKQVPIIKHLDNGGVIVGLGMGITGHVSAAHLFDQNATNEFRSRMKKIKYAINAKIDVRALTVDPVHKRCTMTAKKSLVQEKNIITNYEDVVVGQRSTGFISKIDQHGMSVSFFNGTSV